MRPRLSYDTDPGITKVHRENGFEPLYTPKGKGTGFGLTLCREIVEHHGRTITSPDNPTGGATFHARLPVYQAPHVQNYEGDKEHHAR